MKIDGVYMNDLYTIENNYDNIGILKAIKYLLGVVANDVQFMNDASDLNNDMIEYLDLGNNTRIKKEDYESLYSAIDTIWFILKDNDKQEVK